MLINPINFDGLPIKRDLFATIIYYWMKITEDIRKKRGESLKMYTLVSVAP